MAIAFSRTMRSLNADDLRGPRIVWLLAVVILAAWTWWFFTAQVAVRSGARQGSEAEVERATPAKLVWRAIQRSPDPFTRKDQTSR